MPENYAGAIGVEPLPYQQVTWRFDSDPPAPTSSKSLIVRPVHGDWLARWIAERHYLGYSPAGARLRLAVYFEGNLVGGMLWERPAARALDQVQTLELSRMYLKDACPKNSESRVLAVATRIIRAELPGVSTLIAYADPAHGHSGTIYKAAGWEFAGETKPRPWSQRPDGRHRRNASVGPKLRWILRLRG